MTSDQEAVETTLKRYLLVYGVDLVLTAVMVGVALTNTPLRVGVVVLLTIATIKATMMAGVFMRVGGEHPIVYGTMVMAIVLAIGLLVWPAVGHLDRMRF